MPVNTFRIALANLRFPTSPEESVALAEQAIAQALKLWRTINLVNLKKNILPTRQRANLILAKGEAHRVETVSLRKL